MFNLLERSSKKKKNSNLEKSPRAARYSARETEEHAANSTKTLATKSIERYRSYNEWHRERENSRAKERTQEQEDTCEDNTNKKYRRAAIKEYDNLQDHEGRRDEGKLFGGSDVANSAKRCVYFRSHSDDGESIYREREKCILAQPTTYINNESSNGLEDTYKKIPFEQAKCSSTNCASGGDEIEANRGSVAPSSQHNNQTDTSQNTNFKLNHSANKINKYSAKVKATTLAVNNEKSTEGDRFERTSVVIRDNTNCRDSEKSARHTSPNEEVGWKRRFLSFAKTKKTNKNDRFVNRSAINLDQPNLAEEETSKSLYATKIATRRAESIEKANKASTSYKNIIRNGNDKCQIEAETAKDVAISEVKYRNIDNKNNPTKVQSEVKRQSRLSLTLGLNLKGKRSKSITDVSSTDNIDSRSYFSGSSSCTGGVQSKRSQIGKAFRYSFLRGRSKSSDTEIPIADGCIAENSGSSDSSYVGSRALKKSKDFLSDLFMARGRNHNRNRNNQTYANKAPQNTQTSTQTQQQKQQKQQQQRCEKQNLAQFHQRKQQKQQEQQSLTKDVNSYTPATAQTHLQLNYHQEQIHQHNTQPPKNPAEVTQNVQNNLANTQLEVISDPLNSSTNNYQIAMSNNSVEKNFSCKNNSDERQQRSNSAGEQQLSVRRANDNKNLRSRSADPEQWSMSNAGIVHESNTIEKKYTDRRQQATGNSECSAIRELSVELNGSSETTNTEIAESTKEANKRSISCCNNTNQGNHKNEVVNVFGDKYNSDKKEESFKDSESKGDKCNDNISNCRNVAKPPSSEFIKTTVATKKVSENSQYNYGETCDVSSSLTVCPLIATMGQVGGKLNEKVPTSSRAGTSCKFHESTSNANRSNVGGERVDKNGIARPPPVLPKITVVDCSGSHRGQDKILTGSPIEQDVFYDFEHESPIKRSRAGVEISNITDENDNEGSDDDEEEEEEDDVFHENEIPKTIYQQKWPLRYSHTKLENVPEQEENDDDEREVREIAGSNSDADTDSDAAVAIGAKINSANNLDTEYEHSRHHFDSPDRSALKSANTSDSNLSNSYPDSGISGMDSRCSSTSSPSRPHSSSDNETRAARSNKSRSPTMQHHYNNVSGINSNNNNNANYFQQRHAQQSTSHQRSPFTRDSNSTDCDDTLLQCDDLEYVAEMETNERLVCIESISLPDVVVESTTAASATTNISASSTSSGNSNANGDSGGSEQIININGATGNSIGNVHFIPIHVEGSEQTPAKRRSIDDSVLGNGSGIKKSFAHMNDLHQKSTIEITEDGSELTYGKDIEQNNKNNNNNNVNEATIENLRHELIEQKSRHNTQIGDAQKNVQNLQDKVAGMQTKIEKLEQELSAKAWNVERLQSELQAAQTDDDFVRKRLKLLEEEKTSLRHKYSENEDEFRRKYEELETQYNELEEKYNQTRKLANNLHTQLAQAQSEAEEWRNEVEKIRGELEAQIQVLKNALENSEAERKICQDKWQKEFEMLRTQNRDREDTLMSDCEWQLRQIKLQAKEKNDEVEHERKLAVERADRLHNELEERKQEVEGLKVYQAEVKSLRGVVAEQEQAIKTLMQQIDNIKGELQTANTNLEEQMKAVKKIKKQCDSALCDKEREVVYRINEVRNQAAVFWEDKLYTEMTRLKHELESVYVDERRDALDKLQTEHIEELRALTTRYTANEDELRAELNELQERFDQKSEEFIEMRDKSDTNLLQMRMHLDRADREYQNAMCREEERRETLEEKLRKEFQTEREEMEEKFRERLSHVREEFAKELQNATQEMRLKHEKELEQQKAKLQTEKEEALQELSERYRKKLAAVEEKIKEIEIRHQHELKDLKAAYDTEKTVMDRRDISNSNEIEQLHRKCRCLTNLFEEMRMRYERRDPRQEDLREIEELRSRCESQERDLYDLTDRLREMQIQMTNLQSTNGDASNKKNTKQIKKPPPKTIPTNCDVIYEDENEERESPPPKTIPTSRSLNNHTNDNAEDDEDDKEEGEDENEEEEEEEGEQEKKTVSEKKVANKQTTIINGKAKTANLIISSKKHNQKDIDTINENDESQMITAM